MFVATYDRRTRDREYFVKIITLEANAMNLRKLDDQMRDDDRMKDDDKVDRTRPL